jgi:hypothetical protein
MSVELNEAMVLRVLDALALLSHRVSAFLGSLSFFRHSTVPKLTTKLKSG